MLGTLLMRNLVDDRCTLSMKMNYFCNRCFFVFDCKNNNVVLYHSFVYIPLLHDTGVFLAGTAGSVLPSDVTHTDWTKIEGNCFMIPACFFFSCLIRLHLSENSASHMMHLNFIDECKYLCLTKLFLRTLLPQISHVFLVDVTSCSGWALEMCSASVFLCIYSLSQ